MFMTASLVTFPVLNERLRPRNRCLLKPLQLLEAKLQDHMFGVGDFINGRRDLGVC